MAVRIDDAIRRISRNNQISSFGDFWAECVGPVDGWTSVDELLTQYVEKHICRKSKRKMHNPQFLQNLELEHSTVLFFKNGEVVDKQVGAVLSLLRQIEALV